jgi:uroporphyrinogen-III synthase
MIRRVVVTRPVGPYAGGRKLASRLAESGCEVFELPLLRCVPVPLSEQDLQRLTDSFDKREDTWLAFLSPTAVWVWRELVGANALLEQLTAEVCVAVQGSGTAEALRECFDRKPDFIPSIFIAEEFAKELSARLKTGQQVLVLQSADGRDVFAPTLASLGFKASSIITYSLHAMPLAQETLSAYRNFVNDQTAVLFMSPSAVRAAAKALGGALGTDKVVSVGPITSQALKTAGFPVWREAQEHSEAGVVDVLQRP